MNILITGQTSYLGNEIAKHLRLKGHQVDLISVRNDFSSYPFSRYDVCIHAAGIAHSSKKISLKEYMTVNKDLSISVYDKASKEGIKHFIFLSSYLIYGRQTQIKKTTEPRPFSAYAKSKYAAEVALRDAHQKYQNTLTILRLPMVFGPNAKGNYKRLSKLSKHAFIFPNVDNKRTFLSIRKLVLDIELLITHPISETLHLGSHNQSTFDLFEAIRNSQNKKTRKTNIFNFLIKFLSKKSIFFNKVFGSFYIDEAHFFNQTNLMDFQDEVDYAEGID